MSGIDHPLEPDMMRLVNRAAREARAILGPSDGLAQALLERYIAEVPEHMSEYERAWDATRTEPTFGISLPVWELVAERLRAHYVAIALADRVQAMEMTIERTEHQSHRPLPAAWEIAL